MAERPTSQSPEWGTFFLIIGIFTCIWLAFMFLYLGVVLVALVGGFAQMQV